MRIYLRYTVSMSSVEDRYIDYITEGSELHRGDSAIGFIESVKVSEVERIELNERTGELVTVGYPDHKRWISRWLQRQPTRAASSK